MATEVATNLKNMFKKLSLIGGGPIKKVSRSQKAGLIFPVGKIHRLLRSRVCERIGINAAVYMAAVMEYMTSELLEISGYKAKYDQKHRISPRHIQIAIYDDEEFHTIVQGKKASASGVIPYIHSKLISSVMDRPKTSQASKKKSSKKKSSKKKKGDDSDDDSWG